MALRAFSIAGEALNFPVRRFETVLRVTALPLVLLVVFNMAAIFAYLSLAAERVITFKDVADAGMRWGQVAAVGAMAAQEGLMSGSTSFLVVYVASVVIQAILIASFMAPLIRYAGLGEKPAPGVIRAPFGPDQLRYILAGVLSALVFALVVYAPISLAVAAVIGFIGTAMTVTYARFPDPESLHTIDLVPGADAFGLRWFHHYQVWGVAAFLMTLALIVLLILHVRPRKDDKTAGIGFLGRSLGVTTGVALFMALTGFLSMRGAAMMSASAVAAGGEPVALSLDALATVLFFAPAIAIALFFGLRLFPYVGVAVCRRSMAFSNALKVTRRFDVFRLGVTFLLLGVVLFGAQIMIAIVMNSALSVVNVFYQATASYFNLVGGEDSGGWILPFYIWLWAMIGIVVMLLWAAFTYGVTAGLWGRLYREAQKS